jgi:hypothetical protein
MDPALESICYLASATGIDDANVLSTSGAIAANLKPFGTSFLKAQPYRRRKPQAICPKRALRNEVGFDNWIWEILES